MGKLVWMALGFGGGCGLAMTLVPAEFWLPGAGIAAGAGILWAFLGRGRRMSRTPALLLLALGVGLAWYAGFHSWRLRPLAALDGKTLSVRLRLEDVTSQTDYGRLAQGRLTAAGLTCQANVYLDPGPELPAGTELSGTFLLRSTAPGGSRESYYHAGQGIRLLAYQRGEAAVHPGTTGWKDYPVFLRQWIRSTLNQALPEQAQPFAQALLLGDTSRLDYPTDTDLKISGIRHVAAVSGMHVAILFACLSALTMKKRYLLALVGLPVLVLFAALAGFTPSVVRACTMTGLMLLARLADREYDGPSALAFSVLAMTAWNPLVLASVSFQLSVASVAGIFAFAPGLRKALMKALPAAAGKTWLAKILRGGAASVSVSLGASVLTVPLSAWYFGTVSLVSVLTNLLTLWVISVIFYGLVAICLVWPVWAAGAALLGKAVALLIRYVLGIAAGLAKFPLAAVYTANPYVTAWLVFIYVMVILMVLFRKKHLATFSCCALLGLWICLLAGWSEPSQDQVRMTVLDVGQGQSILIQWQGKSCLIDCGGDSPESAADVAAQALLSQGITQLDAAIVTHTDADHAGGMGNLLYRVGSQVLFLPPEQTELADAAEEVVYVTREVTVQAGSGRIRIFPPVYNGGGNENSLCVLFESEACDILITGDRGGFGERALLRRHELSEVDVLIAGHHGAADAASQELLAAVRPEIVVISAGADNPYGHPAPQTLERLTRFGCTVYRTDRDGTITIRR